LEDSRVVRQQRVFVRCEVWFDRLDQQVVAESEDLSKRGVFVRTDMLLPVGDIVELTISLPGGNDFRVIARVAHLLSPSVARALGRRTGMGFEFLDQDKERLGRLSAYLDDLIEEFTPPPREMPTGCRVLIADPNSPLLARLRTSLRHAGFQVESVESGAEAYARCSDAAPHILVAAIDLPGTDGWKLTRMLADNPRTRAIQVVLMADDASDMTRLEAYRLGVKDFVHKPFTDEELTIRLRRLSLASRHADGPMLRGNLAEISLATLLSLLEFERKSGILVVLSGPDAARLFVAGGSVVKIEGPAGEADALGRLMRVLDWDEGNFEFTRCEVVGSDEIGLSTSRLLLEHARVRDEQSRH
jgi:CheY-like chemotaxis protein